MGRSCGWWAIALAILLALPALAAEELDLFDIGLQELEADAPAAALESFRQLASAEPDDPLAHYYLGVAAVQAGSDVVAVNAFRRAAVLDPELPGVQANLGLTLYRMGSIEEAETHLLEALLQGPDDAEVLLHLGLIDKSRGEWDRAIRLFGESAALDPDLAALAHFEAAQAALARGDEPAAIRALELAVAAPGPADSRQAAAALLDRLEGLDPELRRISLRGSVGIEYDDNVTVSEQDFTTGISDIAGVIDAGIDLYAIRTRGSVLYAGYDFYQSLYRDLAGFNLQSHAPHLVYEVQLGRFLPHVAYRYATQTLGGRDFIDEHRVDVGLETQITDSWYGDVGIRMRHLDFADTPARDANRLSLPISTRLHLRDGLVTLDLGWEPEWQDARGPQFSYWAQTVSTGASLLLPLGRRPLDINATYDYVHRDFTGITARIRDKRRDRLHVFTSGLSLPIVSPLELLFDYIHISSSSNLPELNYSQNIVSVRLGAWY